MLGRAVPSSMGIAGNQKRYFEGKQCLCSGLYSLNCSFNRNMYWICCEQKGGWNVGLCPGLVLVMVLSEETKKARIIHELSRNPFLMGLQRDILKSVRLH